MSFASVVKLANSFCHCIKHNREMFDGKVRCQKLEGNLKEKWYETEPNCIYINCAKRSSNLKPSNGLYAEAKI